MPVKSALLGKSPALLPLPSAFVQTGTRINDALPNKKCMCPEVATVQSGSFPSSPDSSQLKELTLMRCLLIAGTKALAYFGYADGHSTKSWSTSWSQSPPGDSWSA